jgi:hypothetical protein
MNDDGREEGRKKKGFSTSGIFMSLQSQLSQSLDMIQEIFIAKDNCFRVISIGSRWRKTDDQKTDQIGPMTD